MHGPPSIVRTDNAPGFQSLVNDAFLADNRIHIDLGRVKNKNRNPVAEKAIQELENEILRVVKAPGQVSPLVLSMATSSLNSRIRSDGLSAREIFFQRDQFTNDQIPLSDRELIMAKHNRSTHNHKYSELCKSGGTAALPDAEVKVGDLVFLYTDRDKHAPRNRYLVTMVEDKWCHLRKFVGDTLRASSYKVKRSEIYKVPSDSLLDVTALHTAESDSESDMLEETHNPMCESNIPPRVVDLPKRSGETSKCPPANAVPPQEMSQASRSAEFTDSSKSSTPAAQPLMQSAHTPLSQSSAHLPAPPNVQVSVPPTRRSTRLRKPPAHLHEYVCPSSGLPVAQPMVPSEISMPATQPTSTDQAEAENQSLRRS